MVDFVEWHCSGGCFEVWSLVVVYELISFLDKSCEVDDFEV